MDRRELKYEKVAIAAEKLKNRGLEPSIINVSAELGVVSDSNNLSVLLEKWYHNQPEYQRGNSLPLSENIQIQTKNILKKNMELEKSLSLLRATLESTADGIMMVNGKGQVVDWNQKFVEMWRIPSHMLESGTEKIGFEYILEQIANPAVLIADVKYLYEHPDWQGELPVLHFKDGRIFERFTQPQRVGSEIVGRVYSFRDITQKLLAEDELRIRERAIEASVHGVAIIDILADKQPIIYMNRALERIAGQSQEELLGNSYLQLMGAKSGEVNKKRIELAMKEFREERVEMESFRGTGQKYWNELSIAPVSDSFGKVKHYVFICNDISQRREMELQLVQQATHDSLTELPNRVLLMDRVEQAILQAKNKKATLAFLFLDIDRFKMINDTLGHSIGDKLLQAVANRLLVVTGDFDTVARLGGDEFVILLHDVNEKRAEEVALQILELLQKPFQVDNHSLKITGSIGISFYPKDGKEYESLMKAADLSMYHAKDSGRNSFRIFEQEMNSKVINRMQLDSALREAMKFNELYLVYQPLIDLRSNKLIGFEALMRWNSRTLGNVSPADFIGIAEENGLIDEIGQWALEEACRQTMLWHKQGYNQLSVAVNISGRQFRQEKLTDLIGKALKTTGLPAQFLELELTESLLVDDFQHAVSAMYRIKDMGISLVIDDFGTGYSSLSYLKQFPVDKLKIDRSFITEIVSEEQDAPIARAIIGLGHSLNLEVLAEGVETEIQKKFILTHGCDYAQGYLFQRPSKADDLREFLVKYT